MKATKCFIAGLFTLASIGLPSCSDDDNWNDVDGANPAMNLTSEHLRTEAGRTIKIAGELTDADGIAKIDLVCHELNLNKTIDLIEIYGEPQTTYNLDYAFAIQGDEKGDNFNVEVTVTDIGGRKTQGNVLVTLDGDFAAPVFTAAPDKEITVLIKAQTLFNLKFSVEDNRVIDYVEVNVEGVNGFPIRVDGEGKNKLDFARKLTLPSDKASYNVTITAYDKAAQENEVRSTSVSSIVNVSELPDFEKMYLADVATPAELNSDLFGVPMLVDHVGKYTYQARYYNKKAGTQICFIPQKTDFSPICFGPDAENAQVLGDNPETVGRITLDKAGVYYLIDFNTLTGAYSLQTYNVSDAISPIRHLHYGENDLNTWNERNDLGAIWWQEWYITLADGPGATSPRLVQDKTNPNIFYIEQYAVSEGEEKQLTLHNWHSHGWWNYTTWRNETSDDPDKFMYYGMYFEDTPHYKNNKEYFDWKYGKVAGFDINLWQGSEDYRKQFVPDKKVKIKPTSSGNYRFEFDAHLERAKMVPIK